MVLLHLFGSLLFSIVCRGTGMTTCAAFLSGLLFVVGIAQFRAIHSLSGFELLVAFLGAMGYTVAILEYVRSRQWYYAVIAACLLAVAVVAHVSALAAVVFCAAKVRGRLGGELRSIAGPIASVVPAALVITWHPPSPDLQHIVSNLLLLLDRMVLSAHWMPIVPLYQAGRWEHVIGVALFAALCVLVLRKGRAGLWAAWTLAAVFMVGLFTPAVLLEEEGPSRFLYLPAAGIAALIGCAIEYSAHRSRFLVLSLLLIIGIGTSHAWRRSEAVSLYVLGKMHRDAGATVFAAQLTDRAVDIGADAIPLLDALVTLCEASVGPGREPESDLRRAQHYFPNHKNVLLLELVIRATGPDGAARIAAERRLNSFKSSIDPESAATLAKHFHNVGFTNHVQGNALSAVDAYEWALHFDPGRFITLKNLGDAYIKSQQYRKAVGGMEAAARMQPADQSVHYTLGNLYMLVGRNQDAETAYSKTVRLKPDHAEAHRRLAKVRAILKTNGQQP